MRIVHEGLFAFRHYWPEVEDLSKPPRYHSTIVELYPVQLYKVKRIDSVGQVRWESEYHPIGWKELDGTVQRETEILVYDIKSAYQRASDLANQLKAVEKGVDSKTKQRHVKMLEDWMKLLHDSNDQKLNTGIQIDPRQTNLLEHSLFSQVKSLFKD